MPKTKIIDIVNQEAGLRLLEDSSDSPPGSARTMQNIMISDRKGIAKRPGTAILGTFNTNTKPTKGFYIFKKAFGNLEIPLKSYQDELQYYHANHGWTRLVYPRFTDGSEFGFKEHIRNIDNEDYCYMCNKTEDYMRWSGAYTQVDTALAGGETTVTVDGILKDQLYLPATTPTGSSATTFTVASASWAADQWVNFYVYIPSTGKIRKITDNTSTTITFDTMGSDPGLVSFQIRLPAFPATGTIIIDSEELAYTAIPTATSFTTSAVVTAHATGAPVALKPTSFPGAPKGNRLEVNLDRMLVGNVSSAISRDESGNVQGSAAPQSVYVSKLRNASDFTFTATRVAGEGDIISFPEGNRSVQDIANQEENFYVFTKGSVTAVQYSQDANDAAIKTPLKTSTGAIGRVIKGENDIYFVTPDKMITSIGRIEAKDTIPQSNPIGLPIKRLTDNFSFDQHAGIKHKQRIFHACKSSEDEDYNNRTLVYNEQTKSYEGLWTLGAFGFGIYGEDLYYANARNPNIFKMFTGTSDFDGTTYYAINSKWENNWMNLTSSKSSAQSIHAYTCEGFIWGGTEEIKFNIYKDYSSSPSFSFTFGVDNTAFLDDATPLNGYFGGLPLGVSPIGTLGGIESDGSRHFTFIIYFPYIYGNFFSIGIENNEKTAKFDITHQGVGVTEEPEFMATRVLNV